MMTASANHQATKPLLQLKGTHPMRNIILSLSLIILFVEATRADESAAGANVATTAPSGSFPVTIRVDAAHAKGELKPIWRFFCADEPNYAYMKHGQKLLA